LNIAPRGSKQGAFAASRRTEKNAVKNENLVHYSNPVKSHSC